MISIIISTLTIIIPLFYIIYVKFNKNIINNIMDYKHNLKCLSCEKNCDICDKSGNIRSNNYTDYFLCEDCVKENNKHERSNKLNLLISNTFEAKIVNFFSRFKLNSKKFFLRKNDLKLLMIVLIIVVSTNIIYFTLLFAFDLKLDIILYTSRILLIFYWLVKSIELFIFK